MYQTKMVGVSLLGYWSNRAAGVNSNSNNDRTLDVSTLDSRTLNSSCAALDGSNVNNLMTEIKIKLEKLPRSSSLTTYFRKQVES